MSGNLVSSKKLYSQLSLQNLHCIIQIKRRKIVKGDIDPRSLEQRPRKWISASTESADEDGTPAFSSAENKKVIHGHGTQCVNSSRPSSKFCSDQFGLTFATSRTHQISPERIQAGKLTPRIAKEKNKKELKLTRKLQNHELNGAWTILKELDSKCKEFGNIVSKVKKFEVDKDAHDGEVGECEAESAKFQCVTSGSGLQIRNTIRHMERCFNKYGSQTSLNYTFQTKKKGTSMYCDFYNPCNDTYCRGLRVLCPYD